MNSSDTLVGEESIGSYRIHHSSLIKRKLASRLTSEAGIGNSVGWIEDAEFALRAQASRNLLWGLSQSFFQSLPSLEDNCWYAGVKKNGYLLELRDQNKPSEVSLDGMWWAVGMDVSFASLNEKVGRFMNLIFNKLFA